MQLLVACQYVQEFWQFRLIENIPTEEPSFLLKLPAIQSADGVFYRTEPESGRRPHCRRLIPLLTRRLPGFHCVETSSIQAPVWPARLVKSPGSLRFFQYEKGVVPEMRY